MQQPRQMYGLGSFVKKVTRKLTRPITKVAKKIVPKEIAGIMRTAAPFLPPGYREAAYLLGTARQTGRISPVDLALAAAPTFFSKTTTGQNLAKGIGDFTVPGMERNLREIAVGSPREVNFREFQGPQQITAAGAIDPGIATQSIQAGLGGQNIATKATQGILGKGGDFNLLKGSLLSKPDGSIKLGTAAALGTGVLSLVSSAKTPQEAGENLVAQTGNSDDYERGVNLFAQLKPELFEVPEQFRMPVKDGGRIGFRTGTGRRGLGGLEGMGPDMVADPKAGLGALEDMKDGEFRFDAQEFMVNKYKEDGTKPNIIGEGMIGDGEGGMEKMFVIETPGFGTMTITMDQYLKNFGIPEREVKTDFDGLGLVIINTSDGLKLMDADGNLRDVGKDNKAAGGLMRTNYAIGSEDPKPLPEDPTKPVNPFAPKPIKPLGDMKMAGSERYQRILESLIDMMEDELGRELTNEEYDEAGKLAYELLGVPGLAKGGRVNYALGTRPTAEESGLGGLPIEADMRYTGGFMPYGAKEKADDVPARLSKNEFVFTADAVRAAGGGSVQKGAQKMNNTMKQLEAKPEAKGMMA